MLYAGIQVGSELDPRPKHSGVTLSKKILTPSSSTSHLAARLFICYRSTSKMKSTSGSLGGLGLFPIDIDKFAVLFARSYSNREERIRSWRPRESTFLWRSAGPLQKSRLTGRKKETL